MMTIAQIANCAEFACKRGLTFAQALAVHRDFGWSFVEYYISL